MVRECETDDCLIHPFRFGKNPARTGKGHFGHRATTGENDKKGVVNGGFEVKFKRVAVR